MIIRILIIKNQIEIKILIIKIKMIIKTLIIIILINNIIDHLIIKIET